MSYVGYFSDLDCKKYEVRITPTSGGGQYQEILLAGDQPFVARYNTSDTPFDPVRTSTASVNIVNNSYLHDALSPCAQGTKIELIDITASASPVTNWVGYLTPKVYDAGYEDCYEDFSLEAADCISSLQYKDYVETNSGGIVTLKSIINQICDACGELDGYYWTISKTVSGDVLTPDMLSISEHNFQYNDTEEEWKLNDVLKEICQYLGFTCLQWGKYMYFLDYQYIEGNSRFSTFKYDKAGGYVQIGSAGNPNRLASAYTVTSGSYMSNGATISMEPVVNKVTVNANMYAVEDFIPNPFSDDFLVNRINSGDFYTSIEITPEQTKAKFPNGIWYWTGNVDWKEEKSGDTGYVYYQRIYDNKYWESVYSNGTPSEADKKSSSITKNYRGGTLVDLGVVKKEYKDGNGQWIIPSRMDYTRYICISEKHTNTLPDAGDRVTVFRLKPGFKSRAMLDGKCFLVINCSFLAERYPSRNYINPDWCDAPSKGGYGGTVYVDGSPQPIFKLTIGDKAYGLWYGGWLNPNDSKAVIEPTVKWQDDIPTYWNKDIQILNNVSWEDKLNCEGVKIHLNGIDTTQEIQFEILNPDPSFDGRGAPNPDHRFLDQSAYMWIKDLSIKIVREGESDLGNDNDVVYENVIDECSINDMNEIKVKITTFTDQVKPSYSHMILGSGFLQTVLETGLSNAQAQKPEENIIQKYVHQYSTPTRKFSLTLPIDIAPFQKLFGVDVDNPEDGYVQLGTEMDYAMGRQTITCIQKDK